MTTIAKAIAAQAVAAGYEGDAPHTIKTALEVLTEAKGATIAEVIGKSTIASGDEEAYIVSFSANGGSGTVASVACAKGFTVKLPDDTGLTAPSQKEFGGWAETAAATKADYDAGDDFAATEAVTLYAFWTAAS